MTILLEYIDFDIFQVQEGQIEIFKHKRGGSGTFESRC